MHWFTLSTFRWNCIFLPYFYRKTYTNLLIFVLFVCSFFYSSIFFLLYSVFNDQSFSLLCEWLAQVDSNHRPRAYQARALTTWAMRHYGYLRLPLPSCTFGGDDGNRTHDPLLAGQVLSQLSYTPIGLGIIQFDLISHWKLNNKQIKFSSAN